MYLPAANSVGISTAGVNAVYIDSTQNVGIGVTSTTNPLTVAGTANAAYISAKGIVVNYGGSTTGVVVPIGFSWSSSISTQNPYWGMGLITVSFAAGTADLGFYTGGSEKLRIDSSGNVGIGTSSPSSKLHVYSAETPTEIRVESLATQPAISFYNGASNAATRNWAVVASFNAFGDLCFNQSNALGGNPISAGTTRMVLDASGNVGIGMSSPAYKLDVQAGTVSATSDATALRLFQIGDGGVAMLFTNGVSNLVRLAGTVTSAGAGTDDGVFTIQTATNGTLAERMRIDKDGNVGIGTNSPQAHVHVYGSEANLTVGSGVAAALEINNGDTSSYGILSELIFSSGTGGGTNRTAAISSAFTSGGPAPLNGDLRFSTRNAGSMATRMIISESGNVGINKLLPTAALDVVGIVTVAASTAASNGFGFQVTQASGADRDVLLAGVNGVSNGLTVRYVSSAMQYTLTGLGTGTVTSTAGVLSAVSDQNMKVADGEIENAIDKVLSLKPRYFYWKDKDGNADTSKRRQLGFYAQEVNAVVPEASPAPIVESDGWGVYDRSLVATLTAAIQEQQALITSLTARITALESKEIS
jgi:hypothetical protein